MDKETLNAYQTVAATETNYRYSDEVKTEHARIMALSEKERLVAYEGIFNQLFNDLVALCEAGQLSPTGDASGLRELYVRGSDEENTGLTLNIRAKRTQDINEEYVSGQVSIEPFLYGSTGFSNTGLKTAPGLGDMNIEQDFEKSLFDLLDYQETLRQVEEFIA